MAIFCFSSLSLVLWLQAFFCGSLEVCYAELFRNQTGELFLSLAATLALAMRWRDILTHLASLFLPDALTRLAKVPRD